jgi:hypothetical protein
MSGREIKRQPAVHAIVGLLIAVMGIAAYAQRDSVSLAAFVHEAGRVRMALPSNGSFGTVRLGDRLEGIRWPGEDGVEFLGRGGLQLRFAIEGEDTLRFLDPLGFEALETGFEKRDLSEGCSGGKRYPHSGRDDDRDGMEDEDALDCIDNDGDGMVDEDFAAVGNKMIVTLAEEPATGLVLMQRSYSWAYGHVRDFIGFTTTLQYPATSDDRAPVVRGLDAALYIDFQIGEPDDGARGRNDRFFLVRTGGGAAEEHIEFIAASDSRIDGAFAAAVVFDVMGPDGTPLDGECVVVDAGAVGRSLWAHIPISADEDEPSVRHTLGTRGEGPSSGAGDDGASAMPSVSRGLEGEMAVALLVETIPELEPGGALVIEWALVFGRSQAALVKNVQRAIVTYRGMIDEHGRVHRWVVPARKAIRKVLDARLSTIWGQSSKQAAAVFVLPEELEPEEIEWLRVGDTRDVVYERIGSKVLVSIERGLLDQRRSIVIEGQLTDGTFIVSRINEEQIAEYVADEAFPPGSLPDDSMQLYPNPFLTSLTINLHVYDLPANASRSASGAGNDGSSVKIYDVQGKLVKTIIEQDAVHPGDYTYSWNGMDEYGNEVAPGVYYCKLQIEGRSLTKRVILLR